MLIDKVRIDFVSGSGGSGVVEFQKGGMPSGGDGGHGGDVYLVGDNNIYDLRSFRNKKSLQAENGHDGSYNKRTGANGKDLFIKVPLITKVSDLNGQIILEIGKHGQKELLLKGSSGGRGNYYFRKGQVNTLRKFTKGKSGLKFQAFLELELKADIVFIGLPNAGKSSMLNILTNTKSKVAGYPFTTLEPYIGLMDELRLMDLPGLILGTSKGKGLGSGFSKHILHTKAIAHFLSLEEENLKKSYTIIRNELKDINPDLIDKPELLVLTKSDILSDSEVKEKVKLAQNFHNNIIAVSIINDKQVSKLKEKFSELVIKNK